MMTKQASVVSANSVMRVDKFIMSAVIADSADITMIIVVSACECC